QLLTRPGDRDGLRRRTGHLLARPELPDTQIAFVRMIRRESDDLRIVHLDRNVGFARFLEVVLAVLFDAGTKQGVPVAMMILFRKGDVGGQKRGATSERADGSPTSHHGGTSFLLRSKMHLYTCFCLIGFLCVLKT